MAEKHKIKIISIVGARPQFIKIAPFCIAAEKNNNVKHLIVHTGQHYDYNMSSLFFKELGIPKPNYHLNIGSGSHGNQTGQMVQTIEKILIKEKPDWVLVFGDTNSTLAGALAAAKLHISVAHVEAGLRSFNKKMPEEINRILTDHCSNILFCPTENAINNLRNEGFKNILFNGRLIKQISTNKTFTENIVLNTGDIMLDVLVLALKIAASNSTILNKLKLVPKKYVLLTVHRAENTESVRTIKLILETLLPFSKKIPVVFPVHPRTMKIFKKLCLTSYSNSQIQFIDPVSYFDMIMLEKNALKILTDSGGVQKEAFWLKTPCITLREQTEWIETVKSGWNVLVGVNKKNILKELSKPIRTHHPKATPKNHSFGKGKTAELILETMIRFSHKL